ncbi:T9SS type A sorting domain-containing protein [candidate division KSB1 bacterium]|nr:T9SS type A sorting domain-containing protein [candidate division KSB1 bacterium]
MYYSIRRHSGFAGLSQFIFGLFCILLPNLWAGGDLTPDASFLGTHTAERIGYALGGNGDVNGDGVDDFLIGTFHNNTNGFDAGATYLILGKRPFNRRMLEKLTTADARFLGESRHHALGFSVVCDGDQNGDGLADILISAPAGNSSVTYPGKIYIITGRKSANWGYRFVAADSAHGAITGQNAEDCFGKCLSYVGDLNGDGKDDFIVGAPENDDARQNAGKVYLFLGRDQWSRSLLARENAQATFVLSYINATVGFSVAGVGDVNGDAIPDFLIGAPGVSEAFLIYGRREVNWGQNFNLNDADVIFMPERTGETHTGYRVAWAGDVNGDHVADMLISALHARPTEQFAGRVYLVFGRAGGFGTQSYNLAGANVIYTGEHYGDYAGFGLSTAGDVDGDGDAECLIGMFNQDQKKSISGKAYFVEGHPTNWNYLQPLSTVPFFECDRRYSLCGFNLGYAGDVDGDHWGDFLVAAPYYSSDSSGQVYLFRSNRAQFHIRGQVSYANSPRGIPNFPLQLSGEFDYTQNTISDGTYDFEIYGLSNYKFAVKTPVTVPLDDHCLTAYDAALVARAALKLVSLTPVQQYAADVDLDRMVTTYDAAMILRGDLGLAPTSRSHVGEWSISDTARVYENVNQNYEQQNLMAFVRGDVDASWQPTPRKVTKFRPGVTTSREMRVEPGATLTLPVEIMQVSEVIAFDAEFCFDPAQFELIAVTPTKLMQNFTLSHHLTAPGILRVAAFSPLPAVSSGEYAHVILKALNPVAATTRITLSRFLVNNQLQPDKIFQIIAPTTSKPVTHFNLSPVYPNPFNATTRVEYELPVNCKVDLRVYNLLGQNICTLIKTEQAAGRYSLFWNAQTSDGLPLPTGIYWLKMHAGASQQMRKIILLR